MITSTIDEAKSQLAELIMAAERGEEVIIARAGKPVARLLPLVQQNGPRQGGQWRGRVRIAPDFDE
jgi:prevent-host-death family protein